MAALNMPPRMLLELCKTMSNQGDPMYSYNLGAMLHGASGDPTLPLDLPGSAEAYARCVTQALKKVPKGGSPAKSLPEDPNRGSLFIDAVNALKNALTEKEVTADSPSGKLAIAALKAAVKACAESGTRADKDVATVAHFGLAYAARHAGDRQSACRRYRRCVEAGEGAVHHYAKMLYEGGRENLAAMEGPQQEKLLFVQEADGTIRIPEGSPFAQKADDRKDVWVLPSNDSEPVPRPACDACGAKPLHLRKCAGKCRGAVAYCNEECQRKHWREHKPACMSSSSSK